MRRPRTRRKPSSSRSSRTANEILLPTRSPLSPRAWPKAKFSAHFERAPDLVYKACVQAIRSVGCDIITVDRTNRKVRFCLGDAGNATTEHELFVFEAEDGSSDLDIASLSPHAKIRFDPYYEGIAKEAGKYLMFAGEPARRALPPADQERPLKPHRGGTILTLGILSFFCFGVVLGPIAWGMASQDLREMHRGKMDDAGKGMTVAGLVCGIIGTVGAVFALVIMLAGRH